MNQQPEDLRGCPFCLGLATLEKIEDGCYGVGCSDCDFQLMNGSVGIGWHESEQEAITAWNERGGDLAMSQLQAWVKELQAENVALKISAPSQCLPQIQEPAPVLAAPAAVAVPDEILDALGMTGGEVDDVVVRIQDMSADRHDAEEARDEAMAVSDEREAFEKYMAGSNLNRTQFDDYENNYVHGKWEAWQAGRAALAATPAADATVTKDEATWCSYIAGIIGCYLKEPDDSPRVEAIAGIIERRLWALPSPKPAAVPVVLPEPSDAELIALNAGEFFFSESPSKYPEFGHGTQYHAGAPGVIAFGRAALALRADPAAHSQKFQQRVQPWMMACFGAEISADAGERNHRFLEEAIELVQACGCTASEAHQLVDYVYGRPVGDKTQEVGGVMVTLAALCLAQGLDMHAAGDVELARIWTKVEAIRAKQAAKPKHSPLPMQAPQSQADARDARQAFREYISVHAGIKLSGHDMDDMARDLARIAEVIASRVRSNASGQAGEDARNIAIAIAAAKGEQQ